MSTEDTGKKGNGWTDREKLTYLFSAMEASGMKLDYKTAPMPPGRTLVACRIMVSRLKTSLKDDLDALKNGHEATTPTESGTPKAGRKRKGAAVEGGKDAGPAKRGRKKKVVDEEVEDEGEGEDDAEVDGDGDVARAREVVEAMLKREGEESGEDEEGFSA